MEDVDITELDAHEQPSAQLKSIWKSISKADQKDLLSGDSLDDLQSPGKLSEFVVSGHISAEQMRAAFQHVASTDGDEQPGDRPIYYHPLLPGPLEGVP